MYKKRNMNALSEDLKIVFSITSLVVIKLLPIKASCLKNEARLAPVQDKQVFQLFTSVMADAG